MSVSVSNLILGQGMPKICVPIVAATNQEALDGAAAAKKSPADIAELRADYLEDVSAAALNTLLAALSRTLNPLPLLFTLRTQKEGGNFSGSLKDYTAILKTAIRSGGAALTDIELSAGEKEVKALIALAKEAGQKTVLSSHEFHATPPKEEMLGRLRKMNELGADIAKLAVMPRTEDDVLSLLEVTLEARRTLSCPVITMSMGAKGLVSRLCGEVFGSCLTFGTAGKASAPGQIDASALKGILETIHKSL